MSDEKRQKVVSAATAISVIAAFLLIIIFVYQLISLGVKRREEKELKRQISELEVQIAQNEDEVEKWLQDWRIDERARQLGYVNGDN